LASNILDDDTTRAMGSGPVNAQQVTSVVGHDVEVDSEFIISRLEGNREEERKTSDHL
jgi:hypothetical protein